MRDHWDEPQPYKISIAKLTKNPLTYSNSRPLPRLPDHISWQGEQQVSNLNILSPSDSTNKPKRRRKIFEKKEEARNFFKTKVEQKQIVDSVSKLEKNNDMLRRVQSSKQFTTLSFCQQKDVDKRLREVNRQLAQHRSSRTNLSSLTSVERRTQHKQKQSHLQKLEQSLKQSTILLKKQQQTLSNKIPSFEQNLKENNTAIHNLQSILKSKIKEDHLQFSKMIDMTQKNESRLKIKQEQLQKINSQLLYKEYELMRNKELNRKREIELIRIKRIQDLQNKNLELYQSIGKSNLKHFENLEEKGSMIQGNVWEDQDKFTYNQESTIKYQDQSYRSATLGEILSPLALSQYQ